MPSQMTPKERILASIDHKPIDRIPVDYWGTPEATQKLIKGIGAVDEMEMFKLLNIDRIIGVEPVYCGPVLEATAEETVDYWGVRSRPVCYASNQGSYMEMCCHPLNSFESVKEIEENYIWPQADWFDFSAVEEHCSLQSWYAIQGGYVAPFYMYTNIRGMEQTLFDLAAEEQIAKYIIGKICDFLYEYHQRLFEAANGRIDIAQLTDDFGTQTGLMISLDMFDRYFKEQYQRFVKLFKQYNIRVFHHDDGSIMPIIPRLVDLGIDVLNPVQWHLPGMNLKELKERFGKKLCFHGGIDNQHVLPFGTVDEVKEEVFTCLEILGSDNTGYILAPCHNIQVITPVENITAMYKAVKDYFGIKLM